MFGGGPPVYVCDDCLTAWASLAKVSICCDPANDIDRSDDD